jgi:predicted Zn-dependent protease
MLNLFSPFLIKWLPNSLATFFVVHGWQNIVPRGRLWLAPTFFLSFFRLSSTTSLVITVGLASPLVAEAATLPPVAALSTQQASAQPSLYAIMMAEFDADRGRMPQALATYKQQSFLADAAPVFERALGLSLQHEQPEDALIFANDWQQQNPDHIPAIFYVTHLALKAHQYELAGQKLNQILQYDPDADLSQILIGIYPTQTRDQAELLSTLNKLDIKNNPSLLVMKAGLLLQFQSPKAALVEINKALKKNPKSPAFLTLKADILQALTTPQAVSVFIEQARKAVPTNKGLFIYQIRYLLNQGKSQQVWQQLNAPANKKFLADEEIKLLAALVGLDLKHYTAANKLLRQLTASANFKDQAYYYLAVSAERQALISDAIVFYGKVMQPDLVLKSRQQQIELLLSQQRYSEAIASAIKLREQFDRFTAQSYILQANILRQDNQLPQALALLNSAQTSLPENSDILFAKVQLLPEEDFAAKLRLLKELLRLSPSNMDYLLAYAQTLVNLKQNSEEVAGLLAPLVNDKEVGLKARQILAQQALHQADNAAVISLLSDNFDIIPDVISGLLLQQAYQNLGNQTEATRIEQILRNELDYQPEKIN